MYGAGKVIRSENRIVKLFFGEPLKLFCKYQIARLIKMSKIMM